jgi:hypothetical protein
MTDHITIPPEALEAAARAMKDHPLVPFTDDAAIAIARAACQAMLEGWPLARVDGELSDERCIILPLTQPAPEKRIVEYIEDTAAEEGPSA